MYVELKCPNLWAHHMHQLKLQTLYTPSTAIDNEYNTRIML